MTTVIKNIDGNYFFDKTINTMFVSPSYVSYLKRLAALFNSDDEIDIEYTATDIAMIRRLELTQTVKANTTP